MTHKHQKAIFWKPVLKPVKGTNMQWFYFEYANTLYYYSKSDLLCMKRHNGYWAGISSASRWATAYRQRGKKMFFKHRVTNEARRHLKIHSSFLGVLNE